MEAIDGRLVFRAVKIERERLGGVEQPDAKPLAAAVWLQDDRAAVEMPPCRGDKILPAGDQHGPRRMDAGRFERGILPALADLEVERARSVDDAAAMPREPRQYCGRQFGGIPVIARVRGGAHPVVKHTRGRRL